MHLEIHIALNYLATHLYNKLPRRRINLFTEILSSNLSSKYVGHWYPEQPSRGSAYRCLKTTDPLIKSASLDSNLNYSDVVEALPKDLSIWVDPGEVSYRVGETGVSLLLWKESSNCGNGVSNNCGGIGINPGMSTAIGEDLLIGQGWDYPIWSSGGGEGPQQQTTPPSPPNILPNALLQQLDTPMQHLPPQILPTAATTPVAPATITPPTGSAGKKPPILMTTAAFAQTKFGSTKLKSNTSRRANNSNRMSPTEFSNYIKQKQREQQEMQLMAQQQLNYGGGSWYDNNMYQNSSFVYGQQYGSQAGGGATPSAAASAAGVVAN